MYKLFYFDVSENFLYMKDNVFIGKPLKKVDFFIMMKRKKSFTIYIIKKL